MTDVVAAGATTPTNGSDERKRVALRLCTLGKAPPQLPLKQEYDILGVETTLIVTPSMISSLPSFNAKDSSVCDKINYSNTMESEATASTMPSLSGNKYISTNKDAMLRKMGIVPLNEKAEASKSAKNCCNLPVRECRDAYVTLSSLSSKVESIFCGTMRYSSCEKDDQRDKPLFDSYDEEDDDYNSDVDSNPPILVGASSGSTFDWDESVMTADNGDDKPKKNQVVKVKILNSGDSLQRVLDKAKGASLKVIKEDRDKPLRGVAYLERFKKLDINEDIKHLQATPKRSVKEADVDNDLSFTTSESNENVDENVVDLVSSSCAQAVSSGGNVSRVADSQRLRTTLPYHFNLDESPHWSSCSDDNRDASNTFGVGATATISKDCNSFSTSGTSPDMETEEGNEYACGNIDESREPFSNTFSAASSGSAAVTPSASAEITPYSIDEVDSRRKRTNKRE